MKEFIRKWLDIKDPLPSREPLSLAEISHAIGELLQQYSNTVCVQCDKPIIAHYGGFYRNKDGEVFCSHSCIDNNKIK